MDFVLPAAAANQADTLPHTTATVPFVLGFCGHWMPHPDGKLRPVLRAFALKPGLHSIGESKVNDLRAQLGAVRLSAERRGYTIIDPSDAPAGLGGAVHSFDAWEPNRRGATKGWKVKWETPKPGKVNLGRVVVDYALMDQYVAHWQAKGLIPEQPDDSWVERALNDADRKHSSKLEKDPTGKGYAVRRAAADLALWQRIADALLAPVEAPVEAPAAPAPKASVKAAKAAKKPAPASDEFSLDAPPPTSETPSGME